MKKLLFACLFLSITSMLYAQESTEPGFTLPRVVVKISPLQFAVNTLELGLEVFNPTYSKSFNINLGFRSNSDYYYYDGYGTSTEIAYRKYVAPMKYRERGGRESYQGIYYSLLARGEYFKGEDEYNDYNTGSLNRYNEKIWSITPGFTIGYQKTIWKVILLDAYVGGGVKFTTIQRNISLSDDYNYYGIFDPGYSGIYPKIGVKIGIGL